MRFTVVPPIVLLLLTTGIPALADGEGDNNPTTVRRIPAEGIDVPADREAALRSQLDALQQHIAELKQRNDPTTSELLPDVMIFERAVRVALDYNEFFDPKDIDKADELLAEGISRAEQLLDGKPQWPEQSGLVVRGYISRIDHTVQPYGLVMPKTYAFNHSVPTRCDIWFHGRGEKLSEVNFLWERMHRPGEFTPDHTIVLHPYGRYSNAFKFAGETDVLEALEDVQRRYRIDEDRISVRGFSMGGAACWQFAVHYPDRWFAANPGAGFSETPQFLKFFQKETLNPTWWEKRLWQVYDCDKYALNLLHCPTIAYSGENDIQKQAADVMEAALTELHVPLRHIIGAGMGHRFDDPSKQMIEASITSLAKQGRVSPKVDLRFTTPTLKYNRMHWLTIDGLERHWDFASISLNHNFPPPSTHHMIGRSKNDLYCIATNVAAFTLDIPAGTFSNDAADNARFGSIFTVWFDDGNGQPKDYVSSAGIFSDGSARLQAHRDANGKWVSGPPEPGLHKRHNLQGPIDDAFMDSFVFVRPTGTAANEAAGKWAASELERAIEHWRRHFRGDARVVNDSDVTDELIQSANLVLWGDPSSNSVMSRIAGELPVKWDSDQITVGSKTYDATHHAPILVYPNPLNQDRYVVLNSSFTFRDYAYLNNARQVPMLPDWAVIDLNTPPGYVWPGKVVAANFFDEQWQLKQVDR
ncbi:MAG: prolyl oligopeptidase family serine peptidase [Planctomycetaceae bacterium]